MFTKFIYWAGVLACILLIVSCFLPWVYYDDLKQTFTGFYSYQNQYGKPGKLLVAIGVITLVLMLLPKIWGKRVNLFTTALCVGYTIKTYILFTSCYKAYCPEKLAGIYLMLGASVLMLVASIFPGIKINTAERSV